MRSRRHSIPRFSDCNRSRWALSDSLFVAVKMVSDAAQCPWSEYSLTCSSEVRVRVCVAGRGQIVQSQEREAHWSDGRAKHENENALYYNMIFRLYLMGFNPVTEPAFYPFLRVSRRVDCGLLILCCCECLSSVAYEQVACQCQIQKAMTPHLGPRRHGQFEGHASVASNRT
jgi:hypothetical protein